VSTAVPSAGALTEQEVRRIADARTYLLFRHPFFGRLAMLLRPRVSDGSTDTFAIRQDGTLLVDRECLASLTTPQLAFVLAHEILHCAWLHFSRIIDCRGQPRCLETWGRATDYAINGMLVRAGLEPPASFGILLDEKRWKDSSDDDIYEALIAERAEEERKHAEQPGSRPDGAATSNGSGYSRRAAAAARQLEDKFSVSESGAAEGSKIGWGTARGDADFWTPVSEASGSSEEEDGDDGSAPVSAAHWMQECLNAMQGTGRGNVPRELRRWAEAHLNGPALSWKELLRRYARDSLRDSNRVSFRRPSRRSVALPRPASGIRTVLPGRVPDGRPAVVAIDTSGSMSADILSHTLGEVRDILACYPGLAGRVIQCDAAIHADEAISETDHIAIRGGGGSSTEPVFDRLRDEGLMPPLLIYFTDLWVAFPDWHPPFPVLWVTPPGCGQAVPFGQVITMNS
jgi:predicted metal-dependent peptidase